uniref:BCR activator of RhoGEF and GTPase n=1 Tax=Amphilophus citrinellus TaxID=61819 RepID=A0A3Q0RPA7_AMPCI
MVEPVGFIEAWKAQFPESEPPKMELRSVGGIEQELEKCKASIRRLEQEVNKERFRMIYLQTLLAKERKSYDKQRWGFRKTPLNEGPHMQETGGSASHGDGLESAFDVPQQAESTSCDNLDGLSPSKQRPGVSVSPRRPTLPPPDKDLPIDPKDKLGMGLGVAALRSNFERIKRANSHSAGDVAKGQEKQPLPPPPLYTNMEFHHDRGLVRVNDRDVSDKISSLGSQAMQMERKRSLHSLPGNLATVAGELRARPVYRGRSTESTCGYDAEYEDGEPNQRHPGRANGGKPPPPPWQPSEFQAYSSVYVGGVMMGEGGRGDDHLLTWPRRSYSPGSFEDVGGGGGYTPDCSSNENLTSSEEDFSSGQSSHVSPSPTTAFRRPFREKSRSPSQNSQNSQHSFDSSSPPTPQSQKRHHRQQGGHVVMSEATIVSVRKTGQIWPPAAHHDLVPHCRASHDNSFHGDHLGE